MFSEQSDADQLGIHTYTYSGQKETLMRTCGSSSLLQPEGTTECTQFIISCFFFQQKFDGGGIEKTGVEETTQTQTPTDSSE